MLRAPLTCRRLSERDGSGSQAACHQQCSVHRPSRNLAGTSRLLNARRSRSCGRKAAPCGKRRVGLEGRRRRFPESCGETRDPQRRVRVSCDNSAMACRAISPSAKWAKSTRNSALQAYVQERLAGLVKAPSGLSVPGPTVSWNGRRHGPGGKIADGGAPGRSPEQIARRLPVDFPDDMTMRISHEAIYQALFIQGRGGLRRELTACLRTGRALRSAKGAHARARQELCLARDHD